MTKAFSMCLLARKHEFDKRENSGEIVREKKNTYIFVELEWPEGAYQPYHVHSISCHQFWGCFSYIFMRFLFSGDSASGLGKVIFFSLENKGFHRNLCNPFDRNNMFQIYVFGYNHLQWANKVKKTKIVCLTDYSITNPTWKPTLQIIQSKFIQSQSNT